MSIKTTRHVTRDWVIKRLQLVCSIANERDYLELEKNSFERENDIESFINNFYVKDYRFYKYTNGMLEKLIDKPFFRESMFDNYIIQDE